MNCRLHHSDFILDCAAACVRALASNHLTSRLTEGLSAISKLSHSHIVEGRNRAYLRIERETDYAEGSAANGMIKNFVITHVSR